MRSSKGTAQFLLMAFVILAILVYITAKKADKQSASTQAQVTTPAASVAHNSNLR